MPWGSQSMLWTDVHLDRWLHAASLKPHWVQKCLFHMVCKLQWFCNSCSFDNINVAFTIRTKHGMVTGITKKIRTRGIAFFTQKSSPPDGIFRRNFVNEKSCILIKISLNFVPKGPIDNDLALVQIMVWCWIGDNPLSEPMLTRFTDAYMRH